MRRQSLLLLASCAFLASLTSAASFDFVVWSSDRAIDNVSPSLSALIASASADSPVFAFVFPSQFTLSDFSRFAQAYAPSSTQTTSTLVTRIRTAKGYAPRSSSTALAFSDALVIADIAHMPTTLSGHRLVVIPVTSWQDVENAVEALVTLAPAYSALIGEQAAIASDDTVDREKREATDAPKEKRVKTADSDVDFDSDAVARPARPRGKAAKARARDGEKYPFPILVPRDELSSSSPRCQLWIEGIQILAFYDNSGTKAFPRYVSTLIDNINDSAITYSYSPVKCASSWYNESTEFDVTVTLGKPVTGMFARDPFFTITDPVTFKLTLMGDRMGYWSLKELALTATVKPETAGPAAGYLDGKTITLKDAVISESYLAFMNMQAVAYSAYACGSTQAAFYTVQNATQGSDIAIGIAFRNLQVQYTGMSNGTDAQSNARFSRNVYDCVGTFSVGSWMGILVAIVLATVLMFGFLMLNAVQTMDRFDDPKQKQILINVKE